MAHGTLSIDLNADLGEGFGRWRLTDDEALLSVVTSANVACGFHAGDPVHDAPGVRAGRRARRPDRRAGLLPRPGRASAAARWTSRPRELAAEVAYQIGALRGLRPRGRARAWRT